MKSLVPLAVASLLLCAPAFAQSPPGVLADEIVIGQDIDTSGTIAGRMKPLMQAADAYLERINRSGGVNGRRIRIERTDSGNKPDKTKANVRALVEGKGVFAMWGISGMGNVAVALPFLEERKVPLIGSTSGADPFYTKTHPMLINVKAGYGDEIRRLAAHLKDTYIQRLGIFYIDNGFGREALKTAQAAAAERNLDILAVEAFKEDGSDIAQAVKKMTKIAPGAILLLTLSGPAPRLVDEYLRTEVPAQFFTLSVADSDALIRTLGKRAHGIVVTQVVPFPWDPVIPIVKEYQETVSAKGVKEFSIAGMEGFILAKALVEGLRGAGKNPTRESLIASFEKMGAKDLGGYLLSLSSANHNGSRFVQITLVGRNGKLVR
ncbi:MAG: ABC transporter substrate-binding protein [Betaproteobacteria bacterium]|nr:ABC transporter substrate-binding protein [Betaproteobacteria bacterium]